jgi:hypothetical protein
VKMKPQMKTKDGKPAWLNRLNRFLWTKLPFCEVTINTPVSGDGTHQRTVLTISKHFGHITMDLTALTEVELNAFRETVLIATDIAAITVAQLDQRARDDELNGNEPDDRLYRGIPVMVVRKGALGEHSSGVLLGREDILSRVGAQFSTGGSAGDSSGDLDNQNEGGDIPSDFP